MVGSDWLIFSRWLKPPTSIKIKCHQVFHQNKEFCRLPTDISHKPTNGPQGVRVFHPSPNSRNFGARGETIDVSNMCVETAGTAGAEVWWRAMKSMWTNHLLGNENHLMRPWPGFIQFNWFESQSDLAKSYETPEMALSSIQTSPLDTLGLWTVTLSLGKNMLEMEVWPMTENTQSCTTTGCCFGFLLISDISTKSSWLSGKKGAIMAGNWKSPGEVGV